MSGLTVGGAAQPFFTGANSNAVSVAVPNRALLRVNMIFDPMIAPPQLTEFGSFCPALPAEARFACRAGNFAKRYKTGVLKIAASACREKSICEGHTLSLIASSFKNYLTRQMFECGAELMPWQRHALGVHRYREGLRDALRHGDVDE